MKQQPVKFIPAHLPIDWASVMDPARHWSALKDDSMVKNDALLELALMLGYGNLQDERVGARLTMRWLIEANEWINERGERVVYVREWGRDCDMCESASTRTIPATVEAYEEAYEWMEDNAEGPCSLSIVGMLEGHEQVKEGRMFRDRGLEAFENGHPHLITVD